MEFQLKKTAPVIVTIASILLFAYVLNYGLGVMQTATDHSLPPNQRANEALRVWVVLPSLVITVLGVVYFRKQGHDRLVAFLYLGLLAILIALIVALLTASGPSAGESLMRTTLLPVTAIASVFLVYRFVTTK